MCCSKRNFIYLFCGLMLALNIQMLQAKLGNKIILFRKMILKSTVLMFLMVDLAMIVWQNLII